MSAFTVAFAVSALTTYVVGRLIVSHRRARRAKVRWAEAEELRRELHRIVATSASEAK